MPKPSITLRISQEAYESLLLEENWLSMRQSRFNDDESRLQLMIGENINHRDSIDVIRQFVSLVDKGITPNALILAAVAKGFRDYIKHDNGSLDSSFNLKSKQSVGHPLKHKKEQELQHRIFYLMWCIRDDAKSRGKRVSTEKAAGQLINELNLTTTEDALARAYRDKKMDVLFDFAKQAMEKTISRK